MICEKRSWLQEFTHHKWILYKCWLCWFSRGNHPPKSIWNFRTLKVGQKGRSILSGLRSIVDHPYTSSHEKPVILLERFLIFLSHCGPKLPCSMVPFHVRWMYWPENPGSSWSTRSYNNSRDPQLGKGNRWHVFLVGAFHQSILICGFPRINMPQT